MDRKRAVAGRATAAWSSWTACDETVTRRRRWQETAALPAWPQPGSSCCLRVPKQSKTALQCPEHDLWPASPTGPHRQHQRHTIYHLLIAACLAAPPLQQHRSTHPNSRCISTCFGGLAPRNPSPRLIPFHPALQSYVTLALAPASCPSLRRRTHGQATPPSLFCLSRLSSPFDTLSLHSVAAIEREPDPVLQHAIARRSMDGRGRNHSLQVLSSHAAHNIHTACNRSRDLPRHTETLR